MFQSCWFEGVTCVNSPSVEKFTFNSGSKVPNTRSTDKLKLDLQS